VAVGTLLVRRNELTAIVGRDPQVLAELADVPKLELPQPNEIANWVRGAEDSNYGVQIARANSEIATREIQRAKDGYKPTVDLVAATTSIASTARRRTKLVRTNTGNIGCS